MYYPIRTENGLPFPSLFSPLESIKYMKMVIFQLKSIQWRKKRKVEREEGG